MAHPYGLRGSFPAPFDERYHTGYAAVPGGAGFTQPPLSYHYGGFSHLLGPRSAGLPPMGWAGPPASSSMRPSGCGAREEAPVSHMPWYGAVSGGYDNYYSIDAAAGDSRGPLGPYHFNAGLGTGMSAYPPPPAHAFVHGGLHFTDSAYSHGYPHYYREEQYQYSAEVVARRTPPEAREAVPAKGAQHPKFDSIPAEEPSQAAQALPPPLSTPPPSLPAIAETPVLEPSEAAPPSYDLLCVRCHAGERKESNGLRLVTSAIADPVQDNLPFLMAIQSTPDLKRLLLEAGHSKDVVSKWLRSIHQLPGRYADSLPGVKAGTYIHKKCQDCVSILLRALPRAGEKDGGRGKRRRVGEPLGEPTAAPASADSGDGALEGQVETVPKMEAVPVAATAEAPVSAGDDSGNVVLL